MSTTSTPASGRPARPLQTPRAEHIAVVLADGQVLVAGGRGPSEVLASVEIYAPELQRWTAAPKLAEPRAGAAAAVLADGGC